MRSSDFNLDLEEGELVGIIGPNGAGKTTIFNLITGVYKATQGSIRLQGTELVGKTPNEITALGIARTFQNIRLFKELTVLDNVRIAAYNQTRYNPVEAMLHLGRFSKEEQRNIGVAMDLLAVFNMEDYADETLEEPAVWAAAPAGDCPGNGNQAEAAAAGRACGRDEPQ